MALARDNLDEIKAMFPDIELEAFLNNKLEMPVAIVVELILANQDNFVKRRKRTHNDSIANNAEMTLVFNNLAEPNDLSTDDIFVTGTEDPAVNDFFVGLAAHLNNLLQNHKKPIAYNEQAQSELAGYFTRIFTKVRKPLLNWALKKNVTIDELLVISFFIENNGADRKDFSTILEGMIIERARRVSLSTTISNSLRSDLEPLKKARTFDGTFRIKIVHLQQMVDCAVANFEEILLGLLRESKDVKSLKGFKWMGKSVARHFSKEIGKTTFECSVCFTESLTSKAVRCTAINPPNADSTRHLFCFECVQGQAEASANEALLSEEALGLRCMASECRNTILFAEISKYLPRQLRSRLEKRITSQSLCNAGLKGLEHCLQCDFAMIIDVPKEVNKVFDCQKCGYSFCRLCEEDWTKHFGLSCDKLRENSEEAKRREIEKKLNEAVVRCCPKCRLQFVKKDACNKMTCACGTTQCYICRAVNITYDHFCNHARIPNQTKCDMCTVPKCLLWEDFKRHDKEAIDRILKESNVTVNIPQSPMPGTSTHQQQQQRPAAPVQQPQFEPEAQAIPQRWFAAIRVFHPRQEPQVAPVQQQPRDVPVRQEPRVAQIPQRPRFRQ